MRTPSGKVAGLGLFLDRFVSDAGLRAALLGTPGRDVHVRDREVICDIGDPATEFWLILNGHVRVESESGTLLVTRGPGDIVGEQSFFRYDGGGRKRARGARLVASGSAELRIVDAVFLDDLAAADRLAWAETMNRVLSAKLDEATAHRAALHETSKAHNAMLMKFVSRDGLAATRASLASGRIDPEKCDCIFWFSDLAGFSKHALTLSPTESGDLVRELMEIQASAISHAGGHVDKFMGDGLMAIWRVPDASRKCEAANAATEAATKAVRQLREIFEARGLPLDIRVGLHLGPAILGDFGGGGRIAFTGIGEAVNTASRYEQAKFAGNLALGRVRLSPAIWAQISDTAIANAFEGPHEFQDKNGASYVVHSLKEGVRK